jgi:organic hydroperoxide reductase OsmC/OhrA
LLRRYAPLRKRFAFVAGNDGSGRRTPTRSSRRITWQQGKHTSPFSTATTWSGTPLAAAARPHPANIEIGSPPEFKGEAGVWAPEEMLVAALNACMMLTFVSFARSKRLEFVAYESAAEGLLANVDGKYRIVEVSVRPTLVLRSEADIAAAQTIMAKVKENCFISNSITADVTLDPQFQLASDVAT